MIHRNSEIRSSAIRRVAVGASVLVLLVLMTVTAMGTAAADAPDCSAVTYNGDGTEANPYEVGNVDQLQCIEEQNLDANYVQVSDIDASGTSAWNGGDGFDPIGVDSDGFTGTFDGADHTVSGLYIDRGSTEEVGLFGFVGTAGRVENAGLENVDITGDLIVGSLIGDNEGTVTKSRATGSISGTQILGGLVGANSNVDDFGTDDATLTKSHATVSVSGDDTVGGLVGENSADVTESHATGSVNGDDNVGGLVGTNFDAVEMSYATSSVSGAREVGGLVGSNVGTVRESYATGSVSGNDFNVGGLVGANEGTVEESYATVDVSGTASNVGGLVGNNGGVFAPVTQSYAIGSVNGADNVGGLVGKDEGTRVTDSYWDIEKTGQPTSDGGTGLTTSEMTGSAATSNMVGFDFTSTWETVTSPDDYPILAFQSGTDPAPANFEVSIDSTNSPVAEGDTLTADMRIENTGDESDTQTITAMVAGVGSTTETVNLNGGESRTETINVPTSTGDAGTYTLTVESGDDTATETVTIESEGDTEGSPVEDFSDELWTAVTQNDGDDGLSLADLGNAIQVYQNSPGDADVDGVSIGLSDLGALIQYYQSEVV